MHTLSQWVEQENSKNIADFKKNLFFHLMSKILTFVHPFSKKNIFYNLLHLMSKNRTFVQAFLKKYFDFLQKIFYLQWLEHGKSIFKTIFKKFSFHLMSKNYGFVASFSQKITVNYLKKLSITYGYMFLLSCTYCKIEV